MLLPRTITAVHGSSPPAQGPQLRGEAGVIGPRFIPACAGTTIHPIVLGWLAAVHPRLRRDHSKSAGLDWSTRGSSPPAQGPRHRADQRAHKSRFIPACAGTTGDQCPPHRTTPVHPRLRRDHTPKGPDMANDRGSSPPAQGPRKDLDVVHGHNRFIPACAGTTLLRTFHNNTAFQPSLALPTFQANFQRALTPLPLATSRIVLRR